MTTKLGWIHQYQGNRCPRNSWNYSLDASIRRRGAGDFASEKFSLRSGDVDFDDKTRERAEKIEVGPKQKEGETHWYSWSFRVADTFQDCVVEADPGRAVSGDTTLAQFHQEPGSRTEHDPPVMFGKMRGSSAFRMRILPTFYHRLRQHIPERILIADEVFRGRWHDLLIQAYWSSSEGFIKVWVNGGNEIEYRGPTCLAGGGDVYHKYGLYRPAHPSNADVSVWYADLRRGDARHHVERLP
jgi:hypothetical protein